MRIGVPPAVRVLPAEPGVYRFLDSRGTVLYLGRATALRARVASYWAADLGDRRHLTPMISRVARIEAVLCESVHEAAWLERNLLERSLLERSLPPWNRTAGGQETEVYLELDERAAAPGLTVRHQARRGPGRRPFGPYLGGLRARQAAAGLNRVLPLAATGTGLTGTRGELARARGHHLAGHDPVGQGPASRPQIAAALAAVLDRDPAAVARARAGLEALRDRASAALAYELAGRIQGELAALDWVTSPQQVTSQTVADFDACGWSGGVLVIFGVRGGRLSLWSQRACQKAGAPTAVAATPPGWAGFAGRNAELAAALAAVPD
jgi:excinuclease UvrABC nuclease subunit